MSSYMDSVTVWEESSGSPISILETSDSLGTTNDGIVNVDHPNGHNSEFLTSHDESLPFSSFSFGSGWLLQLAEHPHLFDNANFPDPGVQHLALCNDQSPSTSNTESFNPGYSFPLQDPFKWSERHSCGLPSYNRRYHHRDKHEPNPSATQKSTQSLSLFVSDQSLRCEDIRSSTDPSSAIGSSSYTVAQADADLSGGNWKACVSTQATIEAANRRRKSRNKKLFFCSHCGRNFTASHNLKQITLANGAINASLRLAHGKDTKGLAKALRHLPDAELRS
ncbi:hypothetical protein K435DRAFT_873392 [Dendrothele bispora CBS 962.96]|uniref:C2H2-type domain-containing protein n=1 Tax=Dendrothele bispora (strain CBS 962.96) TaxID=1314807 RepID=A0A4S8KZA7_DENBC|nr:hypothetical protein K435DRAFT_873392 [Dendrothele bispora CBS 962.96]